MECSLLMLNFGMQAKRAPHAAIEETGVTAAFPIMSTNYNTWDTVTAIARIQPSIRPTSAAKIKASKVRSVRKLLREYFEVKLFITP